MNSHHDLSEYTLVREEMISIKSCITTYMGYVLGGTGAALFGMAAINRSDNNYFLAYAPAGLAVVLLMVLLVLFYKFASHNRAAGYCKALSQEMRDTSGGPTELISWERCMQFLRESDRDRTVLIDPLEIVELDGVENKGILIRALDNVVGRHPQVDRFKFRRGCKLVLLSLVGMQEETSSWNFPIFVTNIFFTITTLLMAISIINFWDLIAGLQEGSAIHEVLVHYLAVALFISLTLLIWTRLAGKLYTLMTGSATVNGYYIRFLSIRALIFEELGLKCTFAFDENEVKSNFIVGQ